MPSALEHLMEQLRLSTEARREKGPVEKGVLAEGGAAPSLGEVLEHGRRLAVAERERSSALDTIFEKALEVGINEAVKNFGSSLSTVERELLCSLTDEELRCLKRVRSKLGTLTGFNTVDLI